MRKHLSISALAKEVDITTRAIRFYEEQGLLAPGRRGHERTYSSKDLVRLKLILRGKRMGLSLAECRELIEMYEMADGKSRQAEMTLAKIAERRLFLERQVLEINQLAIELDGIAEHCKMLMNGYPAS